MKFNLNPSFFAAMAIVGLSLVGCGNGDSSKTEGGSTAQSSGGGSGDKKNYKLAFVTNNASDYWTIVRRGVEKADAELDNVEVEFQLPKPPEAADQKTIIENLLTKGVDGIAMSPVDPVNEKDLINDAASKTLLITQDSDAADSNRAFYIGTDNRAAGMKLGEEIKKALPGGGKIVIFVGQLDAQNAMDRIGGIEEALKGSNVVIADKRADNADHAKAKTNASDILTSVPDVKALVGIWSYNGPALLSAVEDAKKTGQVKILCFDEEPETLRGVKSGAITATVVQQPWEFGYQGTKLMADYLAGKKEAIPADKKIIIDTKVITAADVDAFKAELDKKRKGE